MTRRGHPRDDAGSASLEFIIVTVGILLPLLYAIGCVSAVSSATMAGAQAAREAARAFSVAETPEAGRRAAHAAVAIALTDQGLDPRSGRMTITCEGPCLAPGSVVHATVDLDVDLAWVPDTWSGLASIPVSSSQMLRIDEYRNAQP